MNAHVSTVASSFLRLLIVFALRGDLLRERRELPRRDDGRPSGRDGRVDGDGRERHSGDCKETLHELDTPFVDVGGTYTVSVSLYPTPHTFTT